MDDISTHQSEGVRERRMRSVRSKRFLVLFVPALYLIGSSFWTRLVRLAWFTPAEQAYLVVASGFVLAIVLMVRSRWTGQEVQDPFMLGLGKGFLVCGPIALGVPFSAALVCFDMFDRNLCMSLTDCATLEVFLKAFLPSFLIGIPLAALKCGIIILFAFLFDRLMRAIEG